MHNIPENPIGMIQLTINIGIQPREGEGIYYIWQDPQTIFGGKEATRFGTVINDKHLSFDEKIPTLKSGQRKFFDWFACFRTS